MRRVKIVLEGVVQGVGFRPFVYRLATSLNLKGYTLNSRKGIVIEVEGGEKEIKGFLLQLEKSAPPLADITGKKLLFLSPQGYKKFLIKESSNKEKGNLLISPDISICSTCRKELFTSQDRRYHYPFINCTDCGPRFTIIKDLPYDRKEITMRKFKMCPLCQKEYKEPANRRYHTQPNGCEECGPEVELIKNEKLRINKLHPHLSPPPSRGRIKKEGKGKEAIQKAIQLLSQGKIVAIKGLGGFHLTCDATNEEAVKKLRKRKKRAFKPFALMALDVENVRRFCQVNAEEKNLLESPQRPILLLRKLFPSPLAASIAPNNNYLGVMLPYTPLHYLILKSGLLAIIATSGNLRDEPMVIGNKEAIKKLTPVTSHFLLHNRDIHNRCDDSILQVSQEEPMMVRRSRGYAPLPLKLPFLLKEILACGAELKNTFSLSKENHAFLSQYIGDLKEYQTLKFYEKMIERFKKLFQIKPKVIAYDLHPDYFSTRYALAHSSHSHLIPIQHHHAHIASCMAENALDEKVIGVAFDGTGYGTDRKIWGGEFLICDYRNFERIGHLKYLPLPGGDKATAEPYRMTISYLYSAFGRNFPKIDFIKKWRKKIPIILSMIEQKINSPLTSSMGRFFDAVSSLLDICNFSTYDGQSAMELQTEAEREIKNDEVVASRRRSNLKEARDCHPCLRPAGAGYPRNDTQIESYGYKVKKEKDGFIIEPELIIKEIVKDLGDKVPRTFIALKFHYTIAEIIGSLCQEIRERTKINKVCLSGGVFQNKLLTELAGKGLKENRFELYLQRKVPVNDGGISLGQVVIANFQTCV